MFRRVLPAALIGTALLLAGCGADGASDVDQASASSAATSAFSESPFASLCARWCSTLQAGEASCDFADADPVICRRALAGGVDAITAVEEELASLEREPMSPADDVLDAVDDFRAAYDTYDDDSNCRMLELSNLASIGLSGVEQAQLTTCQLEANTAALNMSSVQALLENHS